MMLNALALALAVATAPSPSAAAPASPPALRSSQALLARLGATGRAEATVETAVEDLLTGRIRTVRGRLALELPHLARLDFPDGERLSLREDGGDWVQPSTRQLVRSGPRSAAAALRWSAVLLESGSEEIRERPLGNRGYELSTAGADSAAGERQRVWLGAGGLPERLEVLSPGGEPRTYRLSGWRFSRARGRAAFVLQAPPGFETVELP
jgi:hypothetical protein